MYIRPLMSLSHNNLYSFVIIFVQQICLKFICIFISNKLSCGTVKAFTGIHILSLTAVEIRRIAHLAAAFNYAL